jgi:hypothetical protein
MPERSVSASGNPARSPEIPGLVSADVCPSNETAKIRILARPLDNPPQRGSREMSDHERTSSVPKPPKIPVLAAAPSSQSYREPDHILLGDPADAALKRVDAGRGVSPCQS